MIVVVAHTPKDELLESLLRRHPRVHLLDEPVAHGTLEFSIKGWNRRVWVGPPKPGEVGGLLELIDNNPLVCADECFLPSPLGSLALIALGPLARAGLLVEPPMLRSDAMGNLAELDAWLAELGWEGGVAVEEVPGSPDHLALHAMALVQTPDQWSEVEDLYEECYGRSTFVQLVHGDLPSELGLAAWVLLSAQPDSRVSLLSVRVMSAKQGKCGAAQVVQAMNTMAGLEETLGLIEPLSSTA